MPWNWASKISIPNPTHSTVPVITDISHGAKQIQTPVRMQLFFGKTRAGSSVVGPWRWCTSPRPNSVCVCVVCGDDLNSRFRSNLDFPRHCQRSHQPTERANSSTLAMMGVLIRSHLVYLLFVVGSSVGWYILGRFCSCVAYLQGEGGFVASTPREGKRYYGASYPVIAATVRPMPQDGSRQLGFLWWMTSLFHPGWTLVGIRGGQVKCL